MRLKINSDVSFTVSEIPMHEENKYEKHSDADFQFSPIEEAYEKKKIERPKSSMGIGRKGYHGTIHTLNETN